MGMTMAAPQAPGVISGRGDASVTFHHHTDHEVCVNNSTFQTCGLAPAALHPISAMERWLRPLQSSWGCIWLVSLAQIRLWPLLSASRVAGVGPPEICAGFDTRAKRLLPQ